MSTSTIHGLKSLLEEEIMLTKYCKKKTLTNDTNKTQQTNFGNYANRKKIK